MTKARFLLFEGTTGVGKSTIIQGIIRYLCHKEKRRSFLHLSQTHTYHPLDPDNPHKAVTPEKLLEHTSKIIDILKKFRYLALPKVPIFAIIETFHLTYSQRPGGLEIATLKKITEQLECLNCKMVFIKTSRENHWERCILRRKDNDFCGFYAKKYANTLKELHDYYMNEQQRMLSLLEKMKLEKLVLSNDLTVDEMIQECIRFWER